MKTVVKTGVVILFFVLVSISLISYASAITGSIGNARMVLRVETGDTVEKYILVKNINDVPIDVKVTAAGDLADDIEILDDEFTLEPNSERKAYFRVKIKKEGTTESNINIQFTPEEGNGVGLSSTVIIIAKGEGEWDEEDNTEEDTVEDGLVSVSLGGTGENKNNDSGMSKQVIISIIVTIIVFVIFIIVLVLYCMQIKKMEEAKKESEKEVKKEVKKSVKTKPKKSVRKK